MEQDGRRSSPPTPPPSPTDFGDVNTAENVFVPCNEARRMSEGGLVMPTCAAINFNNNNSNRMVATVPKRKFSFPAALHSPSLQAELANCNGVNVGPSLTVATARRRFSNVSDVVSRKLSHTIGWRTAVPTEQIARQGKYMCIQYIRWKLKRAGAYTKKCAGALRCAHAAVKTAAAMEMNATAADHLQHNSGYFIPPQAGGDTSVLGDELQNDSVPREVFPAVLRVGLQLERLDPKLYAANSHVCGVTGDGIVSPPSVATSLLQQRLEHRHPTFRWDEVAETTTAAVLLVSVSRELFRAGAQVTWAKIVSLLCLATRLAIDCARRGCAEQLPDLIEAVGEVIEDDLAAWIHYNGGWMGLQTTYFKPVIVNVENPVFTQILYLISLLVMVIFFLLLLKWFNFISVFR